MFRYCEDNTYIIVIVLFGEVFITFKDNIVLLRFSFTLWIGYYSGRAIQLYLADLHCECRTEHSILH